MECCNIGNMKEPSESYQDALLQYSNTPILQGWTGGDI